MANKKGFLKKIIAAGLSVVILSATVLSVAALTANDATQNKDTLSTSEIHTDNILDKASILLTDDDEVIRTDNNGIISMTILKAFPVTIDNKGEKLTVNIARGTVSDVLNKAGIVLGDNDKVSPSLDTEVDKDTEIVIKESVSLQITLKGEEDTYEVPNGTVEQALESIGVNVDDNDKVNVDLDENVYEGMEITYVDVEVKEETETVTIDYKTKKEYDSSLAQGETEIKQYGSEGEKTVKNKNTYEDGVLVDTQEVSSTVTQKAVPQIKVVGTKKKTETTTTTASTGGAGTFTDNNGNTVSYKSIVTGSGTAYTAKSGSKTSTGAYASVGGVAVNPNIIPYGSKLYIQATDGSYVYGYATAVDTGGALMDGSAIVDLFMDSYADCAAFGRRDVTIYIL
jgi:uncharacterized protein YabE (DUF348 family)/3D (Asp-Asp-Asp) domain-containing protein